MVENVLIGAILTGLVVLLIGSRLNTALLFVGAVSICLFAGLVSSEELLRCYSNETVITLLLLLQVSSVVERTVFVPQLSKQIFSGKNHRFTFFKLSTFSLLLSSHLNNTAVVASLMGVVRNNKLHPPSKLLIPLSYASIMGGVLTLIGTSTNLIINSFVIDKELPGLQFYDFFYVGAPLAIVGLIYLIWILPGILPDHGIKQTNKNSDYFVEAEVATDSKLVGKTVEQNGLRNMEHLFLAEIVRKEGLISPVTPYERIRSGDSLVFTGDIHQIHELRKFEGLKILDKFDDILKSNLQEVVIRHNAPIIGQRVKDSQFRTKFDAVIVAIRRGTERLSGKIGAMTLYPGDNLVLAVGTEFEKHRNLRRNFIFVSPVEANAAYTQQESNIILGSFLLAIVLAAMGWMSLFKVMVGLLFLYLGLGYLKLKNLRNNLNLDILLMIGSSLGLSAAMSNYGVDKDIGGFILGVLGTDTPMAALAGIYITTVIVTELVTNNAAAALMFPIAWSTAQQLGVDPMPFIMAIAYAASASFLTPIGYQTNTMVFSVGNYAFTDYFKGGIFLSILYGIVVILLTPYFFPF